MQLGQPIPKRTGARWKDYEQALGLPFARLPSAVTVGSEPARSPAGHAMSTRRMAGAESSTRLTGAKLTAWRQVPEAAN
jgi:hypothetical protein